MNKQIDPFLLGDFLTEYEFSTKHALSCSDVDGRPLKDLIEHADKEMLKLWANIHLGYREQTGFSPLKKEIAKFYKNVSEEEIFQSSATQEACYTLFQCLLTPADHVITTPGYQTYRSIPEFIGAKVSFWKPNDAFNFDVEDLKKSIQPNTKLIIINFPHNPTGRLIEKESLKQIIHLCEENNIYLLSDEIFRYSELDESDRLPPAVNLSDKAISVSGLSKIFGLAGLRIGWAVVKDKELLRRMRKYKAYTTICSNPMSEILATMALRQKERILEENRQIVQANKEILGRFLAKHTTLFSCQTPKSMLCFPKLLTGESATEFCKKAVEKAGIMIAPSSVFELEDQHFRIGLGRKKFEEYLEEFQKFLKKLQKVE